MTASAKRRLPCPKCSHILLAGMTQAGEVLTCVCGTPVLVPTLRELRTLDTEAPSASTVASPGRVWSPAQGALFVAGCLILLAAVFAHFRIAPQRRDLNIRQPAFPEMPFDVQILTPTQAWEAWEHFRDEKLEYRPTPKYLKNRSEYKIISLKLYAAWIGALVGIVLAVVSMLIPHGLGARVSR